MAITQIRILNILLKSLLDRELIPKTIYDGASEIINSTSDFPEFFRYPVCCPKEEEKNGCSQSQIGNADGEVDF
jgi:hypothetical protein